MLFDGGEFILESLLSSSINSLDSSPPINVENVSTIALIDDGTGIKSRAEIWFSQYIGRYCSLSHGVTVRL